MKGVRRARVLGRNSKELAIPGEALVSMDLAILGGGLVTTDLVIPKCARGLVSTVWVIPDGASVNGFGDPREGLVSMALVMKGWCLRIW